MRERESIVCVSDGRLPGVSKMLRRYDFSFESGRTRETGVDLILTPLSCSVTSVSV